MPESRFASLRRCLAAPALGRRSLLAAALAAVPIGAAADGEEARARRKGHKHRCPAARRCPDGCCPPGTTCDAGICINGSLQPGDVCKQRQPAACASAVCGCNGDVRPCTCRNVDCAGPGGDCTQTGTNGCCVGVCSGVLPPFRCSGA
jgi:hypothetical protein